MCPLCGLHHSIKHYNPEDLPLDIEAVLKVGLGRGKGTKVVSRYSLLGDNDVSPKIVDRVLTLCGLFLDNKIITLNYLKHRLAIKDALPSEIVGVKEYHKLRDDLESMRVTAEMEKKRGDLEFDRAERLLKIVNSQQAKVTQDNRLREDADTLRVQAETDGIRADKEAGRANSLQVTVNSLHGRIEELETQLSSAKSSGSKLVMEIEEAETREQDSNEVLDDLIKTIEERTDYEHDPNVDSKEEFIAYVLSRLLEDIEALKAENDE
jgi:chromosome segregation ATPase